MSLMQLVGAINDTFFTSYTVNYKYLLWQYTFNCESPIYSTKPFRPRRILFNPPISSSNTPLIPFLQIGILINIYPSITLPFNSN